MFQVVMASAFLANSMLLGSQPSSNPSAEFKEYLVGDLGGRSANWVENAGSNFLYHNEGGGIRQVMINTSTPHDGNTYFTVSANVSGAAKFVGMGVNSPRLGDYPFYSYRSGPVGGSTPRAIHWFDSSNSTWALAVNGATIFRAFSTGRTDFYGPIQADSFLLSSPRSEYSSGSKLDSFTQIPIGGLDYRLHRIHLPDGSEIASFRARIQDVNPSANLQVSLVRVNAEVNSITIIATATSSGSSGGAFYFAPSILAGAKFVDNAEYTYYIFYSPIVNTEYDSSRVQVFVSEI